MRAALPRDPTNTCYKANAYIPDNNANNTSAHYQGFQGAGTSLFMFSSLINQATTTGWIYLGPVSTGSSGAATITLDDTGPVGTYTANFIADGHGYYEGECTSFAAWAIRSDGWPHTKSPDNLGNADQWTGAYTDSGPHVGDIAQWDPNVNGAGSLGHVAYVAAFNSDGWSSLGAGDPRVRSEKFKAVSERTRGAVRR
jgi:surface antigen